MPRFVTEQAVNLLNAHLGKAVKGSKILLLGVSYKPDVSDMRESPALEILELLKNLGAKVSYHDPFVPELKNDHFDLHSEPLKPLTIRSKDLIIVTTGHSKVNYTVIAKHARLIFDTRNIPTPAFRSPKVIRL